MWKDKPTIINKWIENATHVAFMDENGDSDMKYIINCLTEDRKIDDASRYFGLTSILAEHDDLIQMAYDITLLKSKYWPEDGCYNYKGKNKKVCFHSREIRRQVSPFSKNEIGDTDFMDDLNDFMDSLSILITSSFIDKEKLYRQYGTYANSPYNLSVTFILERLVAHQLKDTDKVIIILESRGKREDAIVLDAIVRLIQHGSNFVSSKQFQKIIGVYFNPKRCPSNERKSYYGLEVADLCAYPIFKYCRSGVADKSFDIIKRKIYGYPKINGYGVKKFP